MEPPDLFLLSVFFRTGAMRRIRNTLVDTEVLIDYEQKKLYFCLSLFHGLQGHDQTEVTSPTCLYFADDDVDPFTPSSTPTLLWRYKLNTAGSPEPLVSK